MATLQSVMADLESRGTEKARRMYARHGIAEERSLGVSFADLKTIAKGIKRQQGLAYELYATGKFEAMYLAGMVADGNQMTRELLRSWAEESRGMPTISEYTVAWVAVDRVDASELAMEWIESTEEGVASAGWCTYAGLVGTRADELLDLEEIRGLLLRVEREIAGAKNRVRYTMNGFLIAVGKYVKPLTKEAMEAGRRIGQVHVDMGETACEVRLATEAIAQADAAGKIGQKRKTIRC